jgi:hypothetical protein
MRKPLLTVRNLFKLLILLLNLFEDSLEKLMLKMLPFTIQMYKINNGISISWSSCGALTPDESLLFIFTPGRLITANYFIKVFWRAVVLDCATRGDKRILP